MRLPLATMLAVAGLATAVLAGSPAARAEAGDVEATIVEVDKADFELHLDDGQRYAVPGEFNFEGLEQGVRVLVFYTVIDGERVVDDLELVR